MDKKDYENEVYRHNDANFYRTLLADPPVQVQIIIKTNINAEIYILAVSPRTGNIGPIP